MELVELVGCGAGNANGGNANGELAATLMVETRTVVRCQTRNRASSSRRGMEYVYGFESLKNST